MIAKILVSTNLELRQQKISELINKEGLPEGHPDLLYFKDEEKLGVEAGKKIRGHLSLKPYSAKGRGVVVESAHKLTADAQNSLLKTLEEPPEEAVIILGVEKEDQLIPTILSRCQVEQLDQMKPDKTSESDITKLIKLSTEERFEMVEKTEDKEGLLRAMVDYFRGEKLEDKENLEFAKKLVEAEEWSGANVGIRGILEYLMLEMPDEN